MSYQYYYMVCSVGCFAPFSSNKFCDGTKDSATRYAVGTCTHTSCLEGYHDTIDDPQIPQKPSTLVCAFHYGSFTTNDNEFYEWRYLDLIHMSTIQLTHCVGKCVRGVLLRESSLNIICWTQCELIRLASMSTCVYTLTACWWFFGKLALITY